MPNLHNSGIVQRLEALEELKDSVAMMFYSFQVKGATQLQSDSVILLKSQLDKYLQTYEPERFNK